MSCSWKLREWMFRVYLTPGAKSVQLRSISLKSTWRVKRKICFIRLVGSNYSCEWIRHPIPWLSWVNCWNNGYHLTRVCFFSSPGHTKLFCWANNKNNIFIINKNNFVQLEDTTIKTECCCSMQRTDRTRVLHHSSLGLHCRGCPDQNSCTAGFPKYNAVTVGNSGAI